MANITQNTDFTYPYVVYAGASGSPERTKLDQLIEKWEEEILIKILGERMYNEYLANSGSAFYSGLINGTTYQVDGIDFVYEGMIPVFIRIIYYWWQRNSETRIGNEGNYIPSYENSVKTVPGATMEEAFNEAVNKIKNNRQYSPTVYHYIDNEYTGSIWDFTEFEKVTYWI